MKKRLALIMTVIMLSLFLCGCGMESSMGSSMSNYDNADRYSVGNTEISDHVEEVAINWLDGSVKIEYHDENTVVISESSDKTISEELAVRWWLDGSTLQIQYAAPNQTIPANMNKQLTITLPESLHLKGVQISTVSGDIEIGTLSADQVDFSSTSGDIEVQCTAGNISLSSTSGNLDLAQIGEADKITIESTSGDIQIQPDKVKQIVTGSTSGEVSVVCEQMPEQLDIDTTSGDVTLQIPKDANLTAWVNTTSGNFDTDLEMKMGEDCYIFGSGSSAVVINTTSGDVFISGRR